MKTEILFNSIAALERGDLKDDIQYIYLLSSKHSKNLSNIFKCTSASGNVYYGKMTGQPEIIDSNGESINDSNVYLDYIEKGKKNLLHINRLAAIEVITEKGKRINVVDSIYDGVDYIESYDKSLTAAESL